LSSPEIIRRIEEAEKESKRIFDQTSQEIAQAKKDLPNRIASIRDQILKEAAEEAEKVRAKGETAAAEEAERIASEARRQLAEVSKLSETRRRQAVERTIELLLS
jgi:vacuolar-type H+-ATPase subunit H